MHENYSPRQKKTSKKIYAFVFLVLPKNVSQINNFFKKKQVLLIPLVTSSYFLSYFVNIPVIFGI